MSAPTLASIRFAGELAALTTALLWAFGGLLFATAGRRIGAAAVNEVRLVLATLLLMAAHLAVHGQPWPSGLGPGRLVPLLASGLVGLALGDLCYFACLVVIGPRLGALLMATAPAMTVLLAWAFLGETLGPLALGGIGVTTAGIATVLSDRRGRGEWRTDRSAARRRLALCFGLLAALGQASGSVLAKLGGAGPGVPAIDPLSAVVVRMAGGSAGIVVLAVAGRHVRRTLRAVRDRRAMSLVCLAVVVGPTCGVWLYQVALHATDAAVAAILVSLVPVFMIPIARVAYQARPSRVAILGTAIAVAGTALLFLRS